VIIYRTGDAAAVGYMTNKLAYSISPAVGTDEGCIRPSVEHAARATVLGC
jgi:hypothetical protein